MNYTLHNFYFLSIFLYFSQSPNYKILIKNRSLNHLSLLEPINYLEFIGADEKMVEKRALFGVEEEDEEVRELKMFFLLETLKNILVQIKLES